MAKWFLPAHVPGQTVSPGNVVLASREIVWDPDLQALRVGNGVTPGGRPIGDDARIPITRAIGIVGGGVTDDSAAVATFLAANKGKTIVFPQGYRFLLGNILMSGSTWNGTRIIVEQGCELILTPRTVTTTLHGAHAMFAFHMCDNVGLDVQGVLNGNRANQPQVEQIHLAMFAGCRDFDVPNFRCKEYRGDGLYITSENASTAGRNSTRANVGAVTGYNSAADGRNLVSIISLTDSNFGSIQGVNVGGFINGNQMPGGFDIEPNNTNQLVENITVGSINVSGQGSTMVAIHGRPETTSYCKGVTIGQSIVNNDMAPDLADGTTALTQCTAFTLKLRWCSDVIIADHRGTHRGAYGMGVEVMCSTRPKIRAQVSHVNTALRSYAAGYTLQTLTDPDIVVNATDIARFGHELQDITGGRIAGKLTGPSSTYYTSRFGVIAYGAMTDTALAASIPANANWTRSYRQSGATYTNAAIADCDLSGSTWAGELQRVGDMPVPRRNVAGVTDAAAMPSGGTWEAGQVVRNRSAATIGQPADWLRLTSGSGNTLGTDWLARYLPRIFTQATTYSGTLAHTATDETQIYSGTLTGAKVGDLVTVAYIGNPQGCAFRASIVSTDTLRIYGINQTAADQAFTNPSFQVSWTAFG